MDRTKSLAVTYDAVLYAKGKNKCSDWEKSLDLGALEKFVAARITDRGTARFVQGGISDGSYNRVVRFSFELGGRDIALKFPKPGHSAGTLAAEKIENEAAWIEFLEEKTNIPVPHVYSCGTEPGRLSPLGLPYILMDWIQGDNLREFLASAPPKELVSNIYQQIASFYLELYRLPCEGIGSVVKDRTTGQWSMRRPLTLDMHQHVLGISDYPTEEWPTGKFTNAKDYVDFVLNEQWKELWSLRNLNAPCKQAAESHDTVHPLSSEDIARLRYEARYRFKQLSNSFEFRPRDDFSAFRAFNPDLDTRNMTVDTTTGQILGVFDLEFTNAMPAQFACDPPLSLLKLLPEHALDAGFFPWFLREYEPVLTEFLDAMQREEVKLGNKPFDQPSLSSMMRNSWDTKLVWYNYGLTHSDHVDAIYWAMFHDYHPDSVLPELPAGVKVEMESYAQQTNSKLAEYEDSWRIYFRETEQ